MREKYVFIIIALEPASSFGLGFITLTANDKRENLFYYTSSEL